MAYQTSAMMFREPANTNANLLGLRPTPTAEWKPPSSFAVQRRYPYDKSRSERVVEQENFTITEAPVEGAGTSDPNVWGSMQWFSLHNGAAFYPQNPSQIVKDRMKGFIRGLPYTLPCLACFNHAVAYIDMNDSRLDTIVHSRDNLFKFWVDFHNFVNKRLGKPIVSLSEAKKKYGSNVKVVVKRMS